MIKTKTTFIVGAGASSEFGLPMSSGLANDIAKRLDIRVEYEPHYYITGDMNIVDCFRRDNSLGDMQPSCWAIRDGLRSSPSIDNYIDNHRHDPAIARCGKLAIVASIIDGERRSGIIDHSHPGRPLLNYETVMKTWLGQLFIYMSQGVSRDEVDIIFTNIAFLVFDYDRCVEQILFCLVRDHYRLSDVETGKVLSGLDIVHAYGAVGRLPWQSVSGESVIFGHMQSHQIESVSQGILTFTEAERLGKSTEGIKARTELTPRLVFLGFSYLRQNIELIRPTNAANAREILGTVYDMSQMDIVAVDVDLRRGGFSPSNSLRWDPNMTCAGFMRDYSRVLQV